MKRKKNCEYRKSQIITINFIDFSFHIKNYILPENIV